MAFWTKLVNTDADLQPKLSDRFVVIMGGSETVFSQNIIYTAKSVTKPTVEIETKEFKLINHKFKYPGLLTWQPIKITFVDMAGTIGQGTKTYREYIDSSYTYLAKNKERSQSFGNVNFQNTAAVLAYLLYGSGYDTPRYEGRGNTATTKYKMNRALDKILIQMLDVSPNSEGKMRVVESWEIFNPIIKSISWGELSYGESNIVEYTLDLDYDFAELYTGGVLGEKGVGVSDEQLLATDEEEETDPEVEEAIDAAPDTPIENVEEETLDSTAPSEDLVDDGVGGLDLGGGSTFA